VMSAGTAGARRWRAGLRAATVMSAIQACAGVGGLASRVTPLLAGVEYISST
jgi:hypothetical protein